MVYHVNSFSDVVTSDGQATLPAEVTHQKINLKVGFSVINALILLLAIPDYKAPMTVVADILLMTSATLHQSRAFKLKSSDWSLTLSPRFANVA